MARRYWLMASRSIPGVCLIYPVPVILASGAIWPFVTLIDKVLVRDAGGPHTAVARGITNVWSVLTISIL